MYKGREGMRVEGMTVDLIKESLKQPRIERKTKIKRIQKLDIN